VRAKAREWLWRYLPAECVAIVGAVVAGLLVGRLGGTTALIALAGTWGENAGYYGTMFATEYRRGRSVGWTTAGGLPRAARNLLLEFSGAELLDSLLIRPASMYAGVRLTGSVPVGLLLGKLAADLVFYVPAIAAYELRKQYLTD
jgi:hypothetical protein